MTPRFHGVLARYGTAFAGVLAILMLAVTARGFSDPGNLLAVVRQASFLLVLSLGFTWALAAAELDLSFAAVASLAAVVCGGLVHQRWPWPLGVGAALGTAALFGVLNGGLVVLARIPSLIATLATGLVATGLGFGLTGGVAWVGRWDRGFLWLGRGELGGVPVLAVWPLLLAGLSWWALARTRFGTWMLASGEAPEAARLAGIPVRRMKALGLLLSALCAGICAVLLAAALSSAGPNGAADFLMRGIAAVLLGMTMFDPGRPNVPGTAFGALLIGALGNGLVLLGAAYWVQDILLGAVMLAAVAPSASALARSAAIGIR